MVLEMPACTAWLLNSLEEKPNNRMGDTEIQLWQSLPDRPDIFVYREGDRELSEFLCARVLQTLPLQIKELIIKRIGLINFGTSSVYIWTINFHKSAKYAELFLLGKCTLKTTAIS